MIKNQVTGEEIAVQAVQAPEMQVILKGLPVEVEAYSYNYTSQEKWENFKEVIECLVTMHAALTGGVTDSPASTELSDSLPSTQ